MILGFLFAAVAFMVASVLLVQRIARRFGLAVDRRALALCAVMALVVNFSAILLSAYLTFNHLMMLVVMVIGSAALVTGLNEYLLRREYARVAFAEDREEKRKTKPVVLVPEEESATELPVEPEEPEPPSEPKEEIVWEVELPTEPAPGAEEPTPEPIAGKPIPELKPEP
ncbi:MAG: hypothetical protein IJ521_07960, partial [Schwartzia sp.]|nr:hypothetical protein [Schwartzia sp. (in: firmicutes)]